MEPMPGSETQALQSAVASEAAGAAKEQSPIEGPLTQNELAKRLTLGSVELVAELYAIAQKQVDAEIARHSRIEGKANTLLTAAGLSLTVAFTFGTTLIARAVSFDDLRDWIIAAYASAIFFGLAAAYFAIHALKTVEQLQINEHAVFDPESLKDADVDGDEKQEKAALIEYRKTFIMHLWEVRQRYDRTYRDKAELVRRGQLAFASFLLALMILCVLVTASVL